ncbi:dienelactone hydrolase family protein [Acidovorax sp. M2(2025)]|uniref:dienelactone hydrolase family protein n=1 Tax=Acidovorax sp. M2(2025) TaxID=3411355 RepID=UPI003BF4995D
MLRKNLFCFALALVLPWLLCSAAIAQQSESLPARATAWPGYMSDQISGPSESPVAAVLPPDVAVTAPAASVPRDKARWSGLWRGWACIARACDVRIAIESVTAEGATLVYAAASEQQAQITDRSQGRFMGDELHARLHTGARLVLRLREGGAEMEMTVWRPENRLLAAGVLSTQLSAPPYTRVVERLPTPWADADGHAQTLEAVVYRPINASGPLPTMVFNHGSTGRGDRPEWFTLTWTSPEVAQYFTAKGWQVVFPQRRGRGKSDGVYDEGFGANRSKGYSCQSERSLPGLDRALADLDAVMVHLQQRPDVDQARLLIGGVSRGGILSVTYAGTRPGMFLGVVNFVGGWIGEVCKDAALVNRTAFVRGATMPQPTLWLYGEHDSYYSLDHSRANFEAFRAAGGRGRMVSYPMPSGQDGHSLHVYPSLWQPDVERYLAEISQDAGAAAARP